MDRCYLLSVAVFNVAGLQERKRKERKRNQMDSPTRVCRAIGRGRARRRVHVIDARVLLIHSQQHVVLHDFPVRFIGHRIFRNNLQIVALHQVIQRLRRFLFVQSVLRDQRTKREQVLTQYGLPRFEQRSLIDRNCNRNQDCHDDHDDHHFQQREPCVAPRSRPSCHYQSLYFVPSRPVPSDFVWTSNTLCPPHESESGSSCIERRPHSVLPVIGSMGILRRKRTFLPCTSTPFTSVSRSGG